MKIRYHGKITFQPDGKHPDTKSNDILTFEDTYAFPTYYEKDEIMSYIKHDLSLVAGGGYNTNHITIIDYEIKQA